MILSEVVPFLGHLENWERWLSFKADTPKA
jgi:hypothetical protein